MDLWSRGASFLAFRHLRALIKWQVHDVAGVEELERWNVEIGLECEWTDGWVEGERAMQWKPIPKGYLRHSW